MSASAMQTSGARQGCVVLTPSVRIAAIAEVYQFIDGADAALYLRDVARLWAAWLLGLGVLMLTNGWFVVIGGVGVIGALLWLARPLQRRAETLVPDDKVYQKGILLPGKGTTRDRALKALAYGEAPLREAVRLAGQPGWWMQARLVMLGLTVLAFVAVIFQTLGN